MGDACRRSIHLKDGVEASQRVRSSGEARRAVHLRLTSNPETVPGQKSACGKLRSLPSDGQTRSQLPNRRQFARERTRVAKPRLSGMSRLHRGQSTLDAWVRPFRPTTLQLRLRTQESAEDLLPGTVPATIKTSKDRKKRASQMPQPPNPYRP